MPLRCHICSDGAALGPLTPRGHAAAELPRLLWEAACADEARSALTQRVPAHRKRAIPACREQALKS